MIATHAPSLALAAAAVILTVYACVSPAAAVRPASRVSSGKPGSHASSSNSNVTASGRQGSGWSSGGLATFYGGSDASGTYKGACGYGDLRRINQLGTNIAAAADYFWAGGQTCGSCYEIQCDNPKYCHGGTLKVTITDRCPTCDQGRMHFDLSMPGFSRIADIVAGRIGIKYRRVSCSGYGGVAIIPQGSAYWMSFLIRNVNGPGSLSRVEVMRSSDKGYTTLKRDWGSNYVFYPGGKVTDLTFRLTGTDGRQTTLKNCVPGNFRAGSTYTCSGNL